MRRSARGSSAATGREDREHGVRSERVEKPKQPGRNQEGKGGQRHSGRKNKGEK